MKKRDEKMEKTMIHPETGEILHRDIKPNEFSYKGEKIILEMPGWYNDDCSDAIFSRQDMAVHDKAIKILKARYAEKLRENNLNFSTATFA